MADVWLLRLTSRGGPLWGVGGVRPQRKAAGSRVVDDGVVWVWVMRSATPGPTANSPRDFPHCNPGIEADLLRKKAPPVSHTSHAAQVDCNWGSPQPRLGGGYPWWGYCNRVAADVAANEICSSSKFQSPCGFCLNTACPIRITFVSASRWPRSRSSSAAQAFNACRFSAAKLCRM